MRKISALQGEIPGIVSERNQQPYDHGVTVSASLLPGTWLSDIEGWGQHLLTDVAAYLNEAAHQVDEGEPWILVSYQALHQIIMRTLKVMVELQAAASTTRLPNLDRLTRCQSEIWQLAQAGWSANEIAQARHITVATVYAHLRDARRQIRTATASVE